MLPVIRRLLVLLLVVSLPIQGWAASRMALAMAVGHGAASGAVALGHGHDPLHGVTAAHDHGGDPIALPIHHAAEDGHGTPSTASSADCCAGHDGVPPGTHGPDSVHTSCGESCHCCISMALPAITLPLTMPPPPADWYRVAAFAFTQVSAPTPDKPPKG